jgi:hypothetical protein
LGCRSSKQCCCRTWGLIGVGGLLLVFAVIQLIGLPAPPS